MNKSKNIGVRHGDIPKVMYAVVCSDDGIFVNAYEFKNEAYSKRDTLNRMKEDSCTHKVVKVFVKKAK